MEQHIPFWDPLILGLEVEEVETKLLELLVLVALVVEAVVDQILVVLAVLGALVDWLLVKQDQLRTQDLDHTEKVAGGANTGGGGGGMAVSVGRGGAGGSGIVVIAYPV